MTSYRKKSLISSLICLSFIAATSSQAEENVAATKAMNECLAQKIATATGDTTVSQLRAECDVEVAEPNSTTIPGALSKRFRSEAKTKFDPYVITPHKMNYILPISVTDNRNTEVYEDIAPFWSDNIEDEEAKYQLSIKVPLNSGDLFTKGDAIYFGMTLQSWWQIYSDNISKPFRETNYQPELFYIAPLDWQPLDFNTGLAVGIEHQSNGRSTMISRSWNRVYLNFMFEKGNFAFALKPFYRLDEDEKEFAGDPEGDDNPDISDYMGYFQGHAAYKYENLEFSMMFRENFATNKGALQLGMTFPLWGKLRGYVQYFNGYGESLIDYNHNQQVFGAGIALTNIL